VSARSARFEIVRTDAAQSWHARFRAANGRIVWTTENYARRRGADDAIDALVYPANRYEGDAAYFNGRRIEVRDVDERESPR
jgi:uncharacterized protein YegP (UPF0339 family)